MSEKTRAQEHAEAVAAAEEWAKGKSGAQLTAEFLRDLAEWGKPPRPPAEVVEFPPVLGQAELWRRQAALDAAWERTLEARRELEREQGRGGHRGVGERDYVRDQEAFEERMYLPVDRFGDGWRR
jgi:hypothetical protein